MIVLLVFGVASEPSVQLVFSSRGAEGPLDFTYYEDFANALRAQHDYCFTLSGEPQCRWDHSGLVAFVVKHGDATSTTGLEKHLDLVRTNAAKLREGQVVVLICLNKIYLLTDPLDAKLEAVRKFRDQLQVPVVVTTWSPSAAQRHGLDFVPFAVNASEFHLTATPYAHRKADVYFSGDLNVAKYPQRPAIVGALRNSTLSFHMPRDRMPLRLYKRHLAASKMVLSTTGFPSSPDNPWFDLVGTRFYEVMATSGALLLCERSDYYADLGIVENQTAAMFSTPREAVDVAEYFARAHHDAARIIRNARRLVLHRHTWAHRAATVTALVHSAVEDFSREGSTD